MASPSVLSTLETIDKPTLTLRCNENEDVPTLDLIHRNQTRVSRLPPHPTVPVDYKSLGSSAGAGPSRQRYFYVAIRRGHTTGVYSTWSEAEKQILDHPCPVFKTFSTRLAAEAFLAGWDGAGRHSLPASSPRPLREHLAMNFPNAVPSPSTSSTSRPSYHTRLLSPTNSLSVPSTDGMTAHTDFGPSPRPGLVRNSASYRHSLVKISSPLRQEVDDPDKPAKPPLRKASSLIGTNGLLSPPSSPEDGAKPPPLQRMSMIERERPLKPRSIHDAAPWSSAGHRQFTGLPTPPTSPPISPQKPPAHKRQPSGLWADSAPPSQITPTPSPGLEVDFSANSSAPKFSRSAMKKNGVVMPVAAPRSASSSSLRSLSRNSSRASLHSSPSMTSLHSNSSSTRPSKPLQRQSSNLGVSSSQDRLSSLAETSRRELQLNKEGLLALNALSPPKPAFMRQKSNSSLSSLSSLTSATSSAPTSFDCDTIREHETEEDNVRVVSPGGGDEEVQVISCTKSDADADGSVESSSMKSGIGMGQEKKKKGGLFKRLTKVLKLEKKAVPGQEVGRRGSL